MQISDFAHVVGLSTDTVRFYIKKGLLKPEVGLNRYHVFGADDVEAARLINVAQLLGLTIRELAVLRKERDSTGLGYGRLHEILAERLAALSEKANEINSLIDFVKKKMAWYQGGGQGPEPFLEQHDRRITAKVDLLRILDRK